VQLAADLRVAYVMLDLKRRRPDVRAYVATLESWLIHALKAFDIVGEARADRVGVWVARPDKPRSPPDAHADRGDLVLSRFTARWATFHGVSLNVDPDLTHFGGIVPCGIAQAHYGVTSLAELGHAVTMAEADAALRAAFETMFGPTCETPPAPRP
jgi:lipoyl(octanoyl) transferase